MQGDIHAIVAIGKGGAIGRRGDLIWKISDDLKRFKSLTTGHPVIMGRKTWESLPKKPLPGRKNVVITRQKDYSPQGAIMVKSPLEALEATAGEEPFVIGGAEIYKVFSPYITKWHLTEIDDVCSDADAFLPLDIKGWSLTEESPLYTTPEGISYRYLTYTRP